MMNTATEFLPDGSLILDEPVALPDVLDILIVGGGPAGTAVAFRAKELGLAALVIEHDDILKRIRDYDSKKLIRPDFGAGKQMGFPVGGPLIAHLQFEDIHKDVMHTGWRTHYRRHSIPARVGMEFTGLDRRDEVWAARVRNHNEQRNEVLMARHVVLALGGGMPRVLDIPGNVAAMSTRLGGAERFVGSPACVIGDGMSAAEAVVAISKAKAAAGDQTSVYWAHRGDKMPKVSEILAAEIFQAVHVNGNLRYLPNAEPVAMTKGADDIERLRVQIDRRSLPNRPVETVLLEFCASHCLACIGQELPTRLLGGLGIAPLVGGPHNKSGFALTPLLETCLPNVYMVGDTLNSAYHQCGEFTADPATFEERSHLGNVKRALTDGVIVANAIAQKLAGHSQIEVRVESTPVRAAAPPLVAAGPLTTAPAVGGQQPRSEAAGERSASRRAALVRLLDGDVAAEQFPLAASGATRIGRDQGDVRFSEDTAMSTDHLSIVGGPGGYIIGDTAAAGAFLKLRPDRPKTLAGRTVVNLGSQWLVIGGSDPLVMVRHDAGGAPVSRHHLRDGTITVGREGADLTLAPEDSRLSRRHLSIAVDAGRIVIRDLKSANGTYLKLVKGMVLEDGDDLTVGHQTLRFILLEDVPSTTLLSFNTGRVPPVAVAQAKAVPAAPVQAVVAASTPSNAPQPASAAQAGVAVTFQDAGKTLELPPGQSIADLAERHRIEFEWDCREGRCGFDPLLVLDGHDKWNAMTDDERMTLTEVCRVDPSTHRLACLARPTGPVVVSFKVNKE